MKKPSRKIKITVTDPWDSKESIVGFFDRPVLVGDLVSLLVQSEGGEWIALLPRYKGQQLLNEMMGEQKFAINIAKLANVDSSVERITIDHILSYASGSAETID